MSNLALKVHDMDNVATVFADNITPGTVIEVRDKKGASDLLTVFESIPYGHKIATCDIHVKDQITKYGEEIGVANADIRPGGYVHVHNMDSMRGRGDL